MPRCDIAAEWHRFFFQKAKEDHCEIVHYSELTKNPACRALQILLQCESDGETVLLFRTPSSARLSTNWSASGILYSVVPLRKISLYPSHITLIQDDVEGIQDIVFGA